MKKLKYFLLMMLAGPLLAEDGLFADKLDKLPLIRAEGVDAFGCLSAGPLKMGPPASIADELQPVSDSARLFQTRMATALKTLPVYGTSSQFCIIGRQLLHTGDHFGIRLDGKDYAVALKKIETGSLVLEIGQVEYAVPINLGPSLKPAKPSVTPGDLQKMQDDGNVFQLSAPTEKENEGKKGKRP